MFSLKQKFKNERRPLTTEVEIQQVRLHYAADFEAARFRNVRNPLSTTCTNKAKRQRVWFTSNFS